MSWHSFSLPVNMNAADGKAHTFYDIKSVIYDIGHEGEKQKWH